MCESRKRGRLSGSEIEAESSQPFANRAPNTGLMNDLPQWLTAFGTVGAVIVALIFSTRDERRRVQRERRQQAEQITGWLGSEGESEHGMFFNVTVRNSSNQCVYRVVARLVKVSGTVGGGTVTSPIGDTKNGMHLTRIGLLRPDFEYATKIKFEGHAAGVRFGLELAFQDATSRYWVRRANGMLDQVEIDPLSLYGQFEPASWENS